MIGENFKNIENETTIPVQEDFRTANKKEHKTTTPRYITVRPLSVQNKERILSSLREKQQLTCKDKLTRITVNFSTEA
jgi:hypothetical protein